MTRERSKQSVRRAARRLNKREREKKTKQLNSCNWEFGDVAIAFQHCLCCTVRFHLGLFDRLGERFTVARRCRLSQMLLAQIKGPADPSETFPPNTKLRFIRGCRVCSGHGNQTHSWLISSPSLASEKPGPNPAPRLRSRLFVLGSGGEKHVVESVSLPDATGCPHASRLLAISRHSKATTSFKSRVIFDLHSKRDSGENVTRKFVTVLTRLADCCCCFFTQCGPSTMLS